MPGSGGDGGSGGITHGGAEARRALGQTQRPPGGAAESARVSDRRDCRSLDHLERFGGLSSTFQTARALHSQEHARQSFRTESHHQQSDWLRHRRASALRPGLMESVYKPCLVIELRAAGLQVEVERHYLPEAHGLPGRAADQLPRSCAETGRPPPPEFGEEREFVQWRVERDRRVVLRVPVPPCLDLLSAASVSSVPSFPSLPALDAAVRQPDERRRQIRVGQRDERHPGMCRDQCQRDRG